VLMRNDSDTSLSGGLDVVFVRSIEDIEAIRETWKRLQSNEPYPKINTDIDRYLMMHTTARDDFNPYIMLIKEHGQPCTMMIGLIKKSRLKCAIARKILFTPVLRQLVVVYGGIIGRVTNEICRLVVGELMKVLRQGEVDAVIFQKLETDSLMFRTARTKPGLFSRDYFPKAEQHWYMSVPDNVDQFWKSCSHNRRKQLRKYMRKLENKYSGQVKMVTFSRQEEAEEGLRIAADISAKTYQRAFGGGLVNDSSTRAIFKAAAEKDWLRIYILFVADEPCAFLYVLKYGRICFAEETAYSPKWNDWNVGSIIHLKVVEQICKDPVVDTLDFGFGDVRHKQLGDCRQWMEAPVFIFAPRLFPVFVNLIRTLTVVVTVLTQHIIDALQMRDLVQRYRRGRIVQKHLRE
jgi:hypothetical protein